MITENDKWINLEEAADYLSVNKEYYQKIGFVKILVFPHIKQETMEIQKIGIGEWVKKVVKSAME